MTFNMIKLECRKAILNKFFLLSILIGIGLTFFSLVPRVKGYYHDLNMMQEVQSRLSTIHNPYAPLESLFNHWIGSDANTPGSVNYFFIFPLLIAIPYGWSYCAEHRNGYIRNVVIRAGKFRYYFSKYIGVFVSGGLAMIIPLLFNFLLTAMFVPAVTPDPTYITGYGVTASSFLSMYFYTTPFLYVFLYLLVDFIFCGLLACLCFALTAFIKSRVVVVLMPFIILLGFRYICISLIYVSSTTIYKELSPMMFLRPVPASYDTTGLIILVEIAIVFTFTFLLSVAKGVRDEIY